MGGLSPASSPLTSSFLAAEDYEQSTILERTLSPSATESEASLMQKKHNIYKDKRPERQREKRSVVVDNLASKMLLVHHHHSN
jgi:hypothetical protein